MTFKSFYATAVLTVAITVSAHAQTFAPNLIATVGSGSEESFFTLDFQDGTTDHSYAFGYLYNGTQTGADMLAALASDTALQVGYDPGYTPTSGNPLGVFPDSFSFNSHTKMNGGYWAYFTGNDGQNWTYSQIGSSSRTLTPGSWDGWSWDQDYADVAPSPVTPNAAPVPEASSIASFSLLLTLGLGSVAVQRRRKSAA